MKVGESIKVLPLSTSDVKWRDPLFVFDDENVTKPQTPAAASTPVRTCEKEDKVVSSLESPLGKKPCFPESTVKHVSKTAPTRLKPNYNDTELVRYLAIIGEHNPLD